MSLFVVSVVAVIAVVQAAYQGDDLEIFKRKVTFDQFEDTPYSSLDEIFAALDIDGDGYLNEEEQAFIGALLVERDMNEQQGPPGDETLDEFMKNAENLAFVGGKDAADVFAFADLDGNGKIEEREHQILAYHVDHPDDGGMGGPGGMGGMGGPGGMGGGPGGMGGGPGGRGEIREEDKLDAESMEDFLKNVEEQNLKFVGDKTAEDIFNYADHDGDGMIDHDEQMFLGQLIEREAVRGDPRGGPGGDPRGGPGGDPRGGPPGGDMMGDPRMGGGDPRMGGGDPRMGGGDPRMGGPGGPGGDFKGMDEKMFQKRYKARLHNEKVSDLFAEFDSDGDGYLTQEEEKKAVKHLVFGKDL